MMKTIKIKVPGWPIMIAAIFTISFLMLSTAPALAVKKGDDPSTSAPEGMVLIPGGAFSAGLDADVGFQECQKYINKTIY